LKDIFKSKNKSKNTSRTPNWKCV